MGKWAESPQTRINTGFLLVKSGFLKVGKTGQMARNLTKIHKFYQNRHQFSALVKNIRVLVKS
nr:MAG TPA: hypothetical protein [Caudoviricetes sp.]